MGSFCIRKEAKIKLTSQIIELLEFKIFFTLKNSGNLPDGNPPLFFLLKAEFCPSLSTIDY